MITEHDWQQLGVTAYAWCLRCGSVKREQGPFNISYLKRSSSNWRTETPDCLWREEQKQ